MVQRITARTLNEQLGGPSERYYERLRAEMIRRGLLNKIGRSFFGDFEKIADWLAGGSGDREAAK